MIWINLIFFENLWFALYSLYLLAQTRNYNEISTELNKLYNTTWATTIFTRYLYLYIIHILVNKYIPDCVVYSYIIHLPPLYNIYIEPVLRTGIIHLYKICSTILKLIFILLFCITIRIHPETSIIEPNNLYMNLSNIYNSDLYECIFHCISIILITLTRDYNYTNYKILKYIYYYQYRYNFTITTNVDTYNYFNHIITLGYYQNVISTPTFAYNLVRLFPLTLNYIVFVLYLYNILNCANIILDMYTESRLIKWLLNFAILVYIDRKEELRIHHIRFICGLVYSNGILWWLLINSETLTFLNVLYKKYTNIYISVVDTDELELDVDEDFWN